MLDNWGLGGRGAGGLGGLKLGWCWAASGDGCSVYGWAGGTAGGLGWLLQRSRDTSSAPRQQL